MSLRPDRRHRQRGQALVETALVMPLLLVFIFGSLYVVYAFMQRSMMNGAAFMAARTVSVRNPSQAESWAQAAHDLFTHQAKLGATHWLNDAQLTGDAGGVTLTEPDGIWPVVAYAASLPAGVREHRQAVTVRMAPEYVRLGSLSGRPHTASVIDYSVAEETALRYIRLQNPFIYKFVDFDKERRIYEPDRHVLKRYDKGAGAGQGRGNLDSQLGCIYTENSHWLDYHKHELGIAKGKPDLSGDQLPPIAENGTLDDLEQIGEAFTAVTKGAQLASGILTRMTAGPLGAIFTKVIGVVGDTVGPLVEKAEQQMGRAAQQLEARERLILTP